MARPELDALLNTLLPFAQTMLREHGEFYPFGATMSSSGEIRLVGAKREDDDHSPSQPLIDLLNETFKEQAAKGELRAALGCAKRIRLAQRGRNCVQLGRRVRASIKR